MKCSIDSCEREKIYGCSHGWCSAHRARWYRHGDTFEHIPIDKFDGVENMPSKDRSLWWRKQAIKYLGGECVSCGYDDVRALQFDHINGDGHLERKNNPGGAYPMFRAITHGRRSDIQLLCANCNWIKVRENKEYSRGNPNPSW